ncbi:aldo/keto reductase [Mesorhizobium sp. B2-3-5]|uniref:aldo/keto reductase n=1 Tax=Mesorhizobium sp. B2-3-5 TaxID=2589958 RepID=UPI002484A074|nr:aldo/keto reductase [Mesorhizobium sp. B2-3-5]
MGAGDLVTVAIAWLLRHPARLVPVLGSMKPERLTATVKALAISLDREQWFVTLEASEDGPVA